LRKQQNAGDDDGAENGRSRKTTESEPAIGDRFVQKIADRRAQRTRQDEGRPDNIVCDTFVLASRRTLCSL